MKSIQVLFEMFMPEARFPDEKFWNKDGSPIHPEPKGPPKGTVGRTHADVGAKDADDEPVGDRNPLSPGGDWYDKIEFDEEDPRDPWQGGFPGSIGAFEDLTDIDAHEVEFFLDGKGNLHAANGDNEWVWDGKSWF